MKQRFIVKGGYYHVYNRGSKKAFLFGDEWDYMRFIKLSRDALRSTGNKPVAYCLMYNHYHFVLKVKDKVSLSRMMHSLGLSYACYYNNKYMMNGHVFQGPYKCKSADSIASLMYLTRYVHRNPINDSFHPSIEYLEKYKWSSFPKYAGLVYRSDIKLEMSEVKKYFVNLDMYRDYCTTSDDQLKRWLYELVVRPGLK